MKSRQVRIWAIKANAYSNKKKSYTVRWIVGGKEHSKTFSSRALADNYRSELKQAVNSGESFSVSEGLPSSMLEQKDPVTWLAFARKYVAWKWPHAAAKSRSSMVEALTSVTPFLINPLPARPSDETLRRVLQNFALIPNCHDPERRDDVLALRWLDAASMPLSELLDPKVIRGALDALKLLLDGSAAAATTTRRKRAVFYNVLEFAVEGEDLAFNPIDRVKLVQRKKIAPSVDRRVVANPRQVRELLTAVTYVGRRSRNSPAGSGGRLKAFFGCLYFAALRPSEAVGLRESNCHLPAKGWGALSLTKSNPAAGKRWTDSGKVHDDRSLKHRADDEVRIVPIPPELVALLREHVDQYGVGADGRLFVTTRGGAISSSSYYRIWQEARRYALDENRASSPLAARPYDLRHGGVSLWLNAGVPATEVADRAGHSVDVLLKVYAKCIDGQADVVNRRIDEALES